MCGQFAVGTAQYAAAGGAVQLSNLPVAPAACVPANFQVHTVPDATGMPVQYAMAAVPQGQYPVAAAHPARAAHAMFAEQANDAFDVTALHAGAG